MKYMTFNSSCAYAGIANMLEAFGIDRQDHEIALGMKLPYLFKYDAAGRAYKTGASLQSGALFNRYLNTLGVNFEEVLCARSRVLQILESAKGQVMFGAVLGAGKHALVFIGMREDRFAFLNNRYQDSGEPEEYVFDEPGLFSLLDPTVALGWLTECVTKAADFLPELDESLSVLSRYSDELHSFCEIRQPVEELQSSMDRLFRPLLLDGLTMMHLIKNDEMVLLLKQLQAKYLAALKKQCGLTLSDELPIEQLDRAIAGCMALDREQIGVQ